MKTVVLISFCFILLGCFSEKKNSTKKLTELMVTETSEMSLLMQNMYNYNLKLKNKIVNRKKLDSLPVWFLNIKTAKLTETKKRSDFFETQSNLFLKNQSEIYWSKKPVQQFNVMVNNCISCHENKCPGPIDKIKKLYIKSKMQ